MWLIIVAVVGSILIGVMVGTSLQFRSIDRREKDMRLAYGTDNARAARSALASLNGTAYFPGRMGTTPQPPANENTESIWD